MDNVRIEFHRSCLTERGGKSARCDTLTSDQAFDLWQVLVVYDGSIPSERIEALLELFNPLEG